MERGSCERPDTRDKENNGKGRRKIQKENRQDAEERKKEI